MFVCCSPLHIAAQHGHSSMWVITLKYELAVLNIRISHFRVELLVLANCPINSRNNKRETPLDVALSSRKIDTLTAIVKSKADVNINSPGRHTPLLRAVKEWPDKPVIELLLKSGAKANVLDPKTRGGLCHMLCRVADDVELLKTLMKGSNSFLSTDRDVSSSN